MYLMLSFQLKAQSNQGMQKSLSECQRKVSELENKYNKAKDDYAKENDDLKKGYFCSKCRTSKTAFEKRGEDFYDHVKDVQGEVIPATQADFDKLNKKFSDERKMLAAERAQTMKECQRIEEGIRKAIIDENNRQIAERNMRMKELDEKQRAEYEERDRERQEKIKAEEEARQQQVENLVQEKNERDEFLDAVGYSTSADAVKPEEENTQTFDFATEANQNYKEQHSEAKPEKNLPYHDFEEQVREANKILDTRVVSAITEEAKKSAYGYVEDTFEELKGKAKEQAIEELYAYVEPKLNESQKTIFGFIKEKYEQIENIQSNAELFKNFVNGKITTEDVDKYFEILTPNKLIRTIQQKTTGKIIEVRDRTYTLIDELGHVIENFDSETNSTEELEKYFTLFGKN